MVEQQFDVATVGALVFLVVEAGNKVIMSGDALSVVSVF